MLVVADLDGTISAAPTQMGALLRQLRCPPLSARVVILTGTGDGSQPDQAGWDAKAAKLASLGCEDIWDEMILFPGKPAALAQAKADWCAANHPDVMVDNTKINLKAADKAGVPLCLLPWASRV